MATLHLGFKLHRTLTDPESRAWAMGLFLGIMTYFVHGVLNNFLDTDKPALPLGLPGHPCGDGHSSVQRRNKNAALT